MTVAPLIRVQRDDFCLEAETRRISAGRTDIGAIVTFTGLCRDEGGALEALEQLRVQRNPPPATATATPAAALRILCRGGSCIC